MLNSPEGFQVLDSNLISWVTEFTIQLNTSKAIEQLLAYENENLDSKSKEILSSLKIKIKDTSFELLCQEVKKKPTDTIIQTLLQQIFASKTTLTERQLSDGLYSLIRVAENTKSFEKPYFIFQKQFLDTLALSESEFQEVLKTFILNSEFDFRKNYQFNN